VRGATVARMADADRIFNVVFIVAGWLRQGSAGR